MKLLTDTKIGRRLGIAFSITLVLMIVIIVTGITYLNLMNLTLEGMVKINNAKIRHANNARAAFADITSLVGRILIAQDTTVKEEARKRIEEMRTQYKQSVEAL